MRITAMLAGAAAAAVCLCGGLTAFAGELPDDELSKPELGKLAHAFVQAANMAREANGLDGVVYSEFVSIVLREHLETAFRLGWDGAGPAPKGLGTITERSAKLHGTPNVAVIIQITNGAPGAIDPSATMKQWLDTPQGKKWLEPKSRLTGAAVRVHDGKWFVLFGVVPYDGASTTKAMEILKPYISKAGSDDPATKQLGLRGLGESKSTSALPPIRDALRADDAETRAVAVAALGGIRSRAVFPLLLRMAGDPDETVKAAAFQALATASGQSSLGRERAAWQNWWSSARDKLSIKPAFAVPTVKEPLSVLLEQWKAAVKRHDALQKREILRSLRDHPEAGDPKAVKLVLGAFKDTEKTVRYEAMRCAAWNREKAAVPTLVRLAKTLPGKDNEMAKVVLLALAQIGDPRGESAIVGSAWSSKNGEVFYVRAHCARYFRTNKSVDWLVGLLTIADKDIMGHFAKPIRESLEHLTGETFGDDGRAWKKWWKGAKSRFRPEPLPDDYRVEWLFDDQKKGKG